MTGQSVGLVRACLRPGPLALAGRRLNFPPDFPGPGHVASSLPTLASSSVSTRSRGASALIRVDALRQALSRSLSGIDGNLTYCAEVCQVVRFATEMTVKTQATGYPHQVDENRLRIPVRLTIMEPAEIGRRIRTARAWAGLSQEELGEILEVSEATVRRMEQGRKIPRSSDISYICQVCGVRRDFFTDEDPGLANHAEEAARAAEEAARRSRSSSRHRSSRGRGAKGNPAESSEPRQ